MKAWRLARSEMNGQRGPSLSLLLAWAWVIVTVVLLGRQWIRMEDSTRTELVGVEQTEGDEQ